MKWKLFRKTPKDKYVKYVENDIENFYDYETVNK